MQTQPFKDANRCECLSYSQAKLLFKAEGLRWKPPLTKGVETLNLASFWTTHLSLSAKFHQGAPFTQKLVASPVLSAILAQMGPLRWSNERIQSWHLISIKACFTQNHSKALQMPKILRTSYNRSTACFRESLRSATMTNRNSLRQSKN